MQEEANTKTPRRKITIGHANTFHDPSISIIEEDCIYAESIERHVQCKRALSISGIWYSWRAIRNAIEQMGILPVRDADITTLSSWEYEKLRAGMAVDSDLLSLSQK